MNSLLRCLVLFPIGLLGVLRPARPRHPDRLRREGRCRRRHERRGVRRRPAHRDLRPQPGEHALRHLGGGISLAPNVSLLAGGHGVRIRHRSRRRHLARLRRAADEERAVLRRAGQWHVDARGRGVRHRGRPPHRRENQPPSGLRKELHLPRPGYLRLHGGAPRVRQDHLGLEQVGPLLDPKESSACPTKSAGAEGRRPARHDPVRSISITATCGPTFPTRSSTN